MLAILKLDVSRLFFQFFKMDEKLQLLVNKDSDLRQATRIYTDQRAANVGNAFILFWRRSSVLYIGLEDSRWLADQEQEWKYASRNQR